MSAGDRFVYGFSDAAVPPEDAMTAVSVTKRSSGTRRLHHIEVHGETVKSKTNEGGTT